MGEFTYIQYRQVVLANEILRNRLELGIKANERQQQRIAELEGVVLDTNQKLAELEARNAELAEFAADAQKYAFRALDPDYVPKTVESAMKALLHKAAVITGEIDPDDIELSPWLLRQADELEKGDE